MKAALGLALLAGLVFVALNAPVRTGAAAERFEAVAPASHGMDAIGDTLGLMDPSTGMWYLKDSGGGVAQFYFGNPGDYPMIGDWDCDGIDTPGLYRQFDGYVYLRNTNTQGPADIKFFFGNPGDIPLAGDFNASGCDSVSIYRQSEGRVYIINELGKNDGGLGAADYWYYFGNPGDKPFVGDFDGDGEDTVGLHRESSGFTYFRNENSQGNAEFQFYFGDPGDRLIAGDWTGDRSDSPGTYRPSDTTFYFRHSNTQGEADSELTWGESTWLPVAGRFGVLLGTTPGDSPHPTGSVTITVAGDMGANAAATATLGVVNAIRPDAHFVAGDLSYSQVVPESAWCNYVHEAVDSSIPFQLLVGNHEEDDGPDGFVREFTNCLPDQLDSAGDYGVQYYNDIGDLARVVLIAPDISVDGVEYGYRPGSPERDWLEATVVDARARGFWVILVQHKVCISAAEKTCEITEELADWQAANVDLVIMGHAHNYQRSHQLSCVDVDTVTESCIVDTDGDHAQGDGAVFVVAGMGGRHRPVDRTDAEAGYFAALMGEGDPNWGHGLIRINISDAVLAGAFVGGDTDYSDRFTIYRES